MKLTAHQEHLLFVRCRLRCEIVVVLQSNPIIPYYLEISTIVFGAKRESPLDEIGRVSCSTVTRGILNSAQTHVRSTKPSAIQTGFQRWTTKVHFAIPNVPTFMNVDFPPHQPVEKTVYT